MANPLIRTTLLGTCEAALLRWDPAKGSIEGETLAREASLVEHVKKLDGVRHSFGFRFLGGDGPHAVHDVLAGKLSVEQLEVGEAVDDRLVDVVVRPRKALELPVVEREEGGDWIDEAVWRLKGPGIARDESVPPEEIKVMRR